MRLKKQCLPGKNIRGRNAERNNPISRISRGERKLDGLVSRLEQSHVLQPVTASLSPPPSNEESPFSIGEIPSSEPYITTSTDSSIELTLEEALFEFRETMLKYFPFVHVPDDTSWLKSHRPFLLKCILAVSSQHTKAKITLGEEIKNTVVRRMYLEKDASLVNLDLLLGLLTFIAWGHDNLIHKTAASVSRFTQLTTSIAFELRLNRSPTQESNMLPMENLLPSLRNPERTLEERRTVLGCWMLSSVVSSYFTQNNPMQWTPYMDECLNIVSENPESAHDETLVHQIILQRVVSDLEELKQAEKMSPAFYIANLRHRVQDITSRIPSRLMQDSKLIQLSPLYVTSRPMSVLTPGLEILLSSIYYTEMSVSALVLSENYGAPSLDHLHGCLRLAQSGIENFFEVPIHESTRVSFPFFAQLARTILVLFRLSTLKNESWDTTLVRSTIDVLQVLDRLLKNIDKAKVLVGPQGDDGFLDRASVIFKSVQSWCSSKLEQNEVEENLPSEVAPNLPDENYLPLDDFTLEDAWLKEYLTFMI